MTASSKSLKTICVLTSGGDAPGMNSAVKAVVRKALAEGLKVYGAKGGYKGLIYDELIEMDPMTVSAIGSWGGTFMYTDRCDEFKTEEGMQKAINTCKRRGIEAVVAIGGDGTFRGATDLTNRGIPTIGVPGTIDNDITATDYTIGFDTAMNTTLRMLDCLADTCESHARLNVVEAMGRGCGDITMLTAIASGAVTAVIPELPFSDEAIVAKVKAAKAAGKRGMLVVVSEGAFTEDGKPYSEYIAKVIGKETGVETKFARFAHVVRGGTPTLRDRFTATRMGAKAVELLLEGKSNLIIAEVAGELTPIDINFALITDRMYKGKLKDGDLEKFSKEDVAKMEEICAKRRAYLASLEAVLNDTGLN